VVEWRRRRVEAGLFGHLDVENRQRLEHILATRIPDVSTAIRGAETQTHLESSIGRTNLTEAISHIGELAADANMGLKDQASHLADIEDHLRRAVMEHPEQVVRAKLEKIEERWEEYLSEARSYREHKAMVGVPLHSELEDDREEIEAIMDDTRAMKTARVDWEETLNVAARITEAARVARRLDDKLVMCVGAAREQKTQDERDHVAETRAAAAEARADRAESMTYERARQLKRSNIIAVCAVVVAVCSVVVALALGISRNIDDDSTSLTTPAPSAPTSAAP
jgi:hypothetical protein